MNQFYHSAETAVTHLSVEPALLCISHRVLICFPFLNMCRGLMLRALKRKLFCPLDMLFRLLLLEKVSATVFLLGKYIFLLVSNLTLQWNQPSHLLRKSFNQPPFFFSLYAIPFFKFPLLCIGVQLNWPFFFCRKPLVYLKHLSFVWNRYGQ